MGCLQNNARLLVALNASAGIIRGKELYAYSEVSSVDEKRLMGFSVHSLLMHLLTLSEKWGESGESLRPSMDQASG